MGKLGFFMRILGIATVVVVVIMFAIVNSTPTHVDLFFAEGDIATFLVIASSFLMGFSTCFVLSWLRKVVARHRKQESGAMTSGLRGSITDEF